MGRYSHSKIDTFKNCPKQYDYQNVQDLEPIEESIHLQVGKLFHSALEAISTFQDYQIYLNEFALLVRKGLLPNCEEDTLELVVKEYLRVYGREDAEDEIIFIEEKFEHLTSEGDVVSGKVDKIFKRNGFIYNRDYKTTIKKLKYTEPSVTVNFQLNFYDYVLDHDYDLEVDFNQIDEVLIRSLSEVPYLNNGKPTKDKKKLAFVLYEDYYEALTDLGLEDDEEYRNILLDLNERGHPLFRRITVPVIKELRNNIYQEYLTVIKVAELNPAYRVAGPLCDYCPFKQICTMELQGGQDESVDDLKRTRFKKRDE